MGGMKPREDPADFPVRRVRPLEPDDEGERGRERPLASR